MDLRSAQAQGQMGQSVAAVGVMTQQGQLIGQPNGVSQ